MKKTILAMFAAALLFTACGNKGTDVKLDNMDDTLSWVMGENIGNTLAKGTFFELEPDARASSHLWVFSSCSFRLG